MGIGYCARTVIGGVLLLVEILLILIRLQWGILGLKDRLVCQTGESSAAAESTTNVSELLNSLLVGYDNSIRPDFGGPPTIVEIDIMVRSMGPISEGSDHMNCFQCMTILNYVCFGSGTLFGGYCPDQKFLCISIEIFYHYNGFFEYIFDYNLHVLTPHLKCLQLKSTKEACDAVTEISLNGRWMVSNSCFYTIMYKQTYSMDCYFRQSWLDERLSYNGTVHRTLALSIAFERWIWKPDTAFYNGKFSYLHTITSPNKFVRLYENGRVLYSSRLTVKASCPMNLQDFPMDTQRCPLKLGSFGYTTRDVIYQWNSERTVVIASDMKMSQFDLISTPSGNVTDVTKSGEYSFLLVSFHLQRHTGNFLIEVYGPVSLLVVLSWLSFWLNREATADRVSLGVTIILTITFHFTPLSRTDLPKVPYPTALDFFIYLSFAFIFATIIQFAIVHYFTKHGSGELIPDDDSETENCEDQPRPNYEHHQEQHPLATVLASSRQPPNDSVQFQEFNNPSPTVNHRRKSTWPFSNHQIPPAKRIKDRHPKDNVRAINSVSKIDRASRLLFPLTYIAINAFYWHCYSMEDVKERKS